MTDKTYILRHATTKDILAKVIVDAEVPIHKVKQMLVYIWQGGRSG